MAGHIRGKEAAQEASAVLVIELRDRCYRVFSLEPGADDGGGADKMKASWEQRCTTQEPRDRGT